MGKDWLMYFVGGNGGAATATKSTKKRKSGRGERRRTEREAISPGCMCSVFQLFDLHHFQFPHTSLKIEDNDDESFLHFNHDPSPPVTSKGFEAPRNSLELLENSSSSTIKDEQFLNIPVGIQIKTSCNHQNTLTTPRASTSSSSKSRGDNHHQDLFSSEYCSSSSSPGPKTPNLVARLMGLDLLPETDSPSSSRHSSTNTNLKQDINPLSSPFLQSRRRRQCSFSVNNFYDNVDITGGGSVSLPETPRISSSSRRSDVEHSRLSLQMNRDNVHVAGSEELEYCSVNYKKMQGISRRRDVMRPVMQDENTSPSAGGGSRNVKNIVHQVKERISKNRGRKFGGDITNTITIKTAGEDEHVKQPKMNNTTRTDQGDDHCSSNTSKQTTPTCSPRLRLLTLDSKNKGTIFSTPRLSSENQSPQIQKSNDSLPQIVKKSKKDGKDRFNSRLIKNPPPAAASNAIRNKKEEPFIRPTTTTTKKLAVSVSEKKKKNKKSSKTTPLSNELLQFPVCSRKDSRLPLTNKLLLHHHYNKQQNRDAEKGSTSTTTRLSSCASRSYCPEEVALSFPEENIREKPCNGTNDDETQTEIILIHNYVKRILKRSGLDNATPVTLAKWFSPLHPLDPSIFHYMELFHPAGGKGGLLSHRSNRKLVFQLVNELLVEILKPYIDPNPFVINGGNRKMMMMMYGSELIEKVCNRIEKFPSANCQVLEDIDALIELADDDDEELMRKKSRRRSLRYEKEEEEIREGIALEIMERLVHETWSMMLIP